MLTLTHLVINQDTFGEMVEKINSNFDIISQAQGIRGEEGKRGAAGVPGPPGAMGPQGSTGPDGTRGTKWYFSDSAVGFNPPDVMAGDYLLEGSTGIVYLRLENTTWDSQGTITGSGGSGSDWFNTFVPATNGDVRIIKPKKTNYTIELTDIKDQSGTPAVAPFDTPGDTDDFVMGLTPANPAQKLVQETALKIYTSEGDSGSVNYRKGKQLHIANSMAMLANAGWNSQSGFAFNVDWDYTIDSNLEVLRIQKVSSGVGHLQRIELNADRVSIDSRLDAEYLVLANSTAEPAITGSIRWNGADFQGFDGTGWVSLTSGGVTGGGGNDFSSLEIYNDNNVLIVGGTILAPTAGSTIKIKEGNGITFTPVSIGGDDGFEISMTSPYQMDILSSTNANPIEITTVNPHGLETGDEVRILSHAVNTNANGIWTITKIDATRFTIATAGNGVGGNTGTVYVQIQESFYGTILIDEDNGDPVISLAANSANDTIKLVQGEGILLEDVSSGGQNAIKISSSGPAQTTETFIGFKQSFGQYTKSNPGGVWVPGTEIPLVGNAYVENMDIACSNNGSIADFHILPFDRPDHLLNITNISGISQVITGVDVQIGSAQSTVFKPGKAGYWQVNAFAFGLHYNQNRANEMASRLTALGNQPNQGGVVFGAEGSIIPTVVGMILKKEAGDITDSHYIYSYMKIAENSTIFAPPMIQAYLPTSVASYNGRPVYTFPWPTWTINCSDIIYLNEEDEIAIAAGVLYDYLPGPQAIPNGAGTPLCYLSGYISAHFIGD